MGHVLPKTRLLTCVSVLDVGQVTDELVECILSPGLQPGAVDVFLDFISYSGTQTHKPR